MAVAIAMLTLSSMGGSAARLAAYRTPPAEPAAAARLTASVTTDWALDRVVRIDFRTHMDRQDVEKRLLVEPEAEVELVWSRQARTLAVAPVGGWKPGVFYTVTVPQGALDRDGQPLAESAAAIFYTRARPTAELVFTSLVGKRLLPASSVELRFSRPVQLASVRDALTVSPRAEGRLSARSTSPRGLAKVFVWEPTKKLRPGTEYTFRLAATVIDRDGLALRSAAMVAATTVPRPKVVGHDPSAGASRVAIGAGIRIRFDRPMRRSATEDALRVSTAGVTSARGSVRWSEDDTLLTFQPSGPLGYDLRYTVSLAGSARSAEGVSLGQDGAATELSFAFQTVPKPAPPPVDTGGAGSGDSDGDGDGTPAPAPGGGSTGAAWSGVENYVLGLINCIRTGGLLQSDGDCDGYGSGRYNTALAPVTLHSGISSQVARPYAKLLADGGDCSHFMDGGPDDRLRRAGYTSYRWAENVGCRSGNPYSAVLGSHLYFQSEKPYGGGHWVNLRNGSYTTVGIGVWVTNGNVRVVTDFYAP